MSEAITKKVRREFRDESESESDKSEQESCKKPERQGKSGNPRSVQKTLMSLVNDKESEVQQSTRATGGVTGPTVNWKCDATIEVYKYNHNKRSSFRLTIVSLSEKHSDIQTLKKDLRLEYRPLSDARRCQIGDFSIDIGISREDKTYIASSQTEWQNLMSRLYSGIGHYSKIGKYRYNLCLIFKSTNRVKTLLVNQSVGISRSEDSTAPTEIRVTVLFQSGAVLVVKHDHIRVVSTNGPFFTGCVETDVTDNDEDSYFDIQIYVPAFEDCLPQKCNVHHDAVISIADEKALQKGEDFIKLCEESYEQLLSEFHDTVDLLPEGESCDSDDESDEEYTPVQTSSGRRVIPPNCLDL